ncbi:acid protease [Hymenopellis radicata]|nr:acid protease [Hymenopellis radicata]
MPVRGSQLLVFSSFLVLAVADTTILEQLSKRHATRTAGGIHVPIARRESRSLERRADAGEIGLGSYFDVTYSVLLDVGQSQIPLVLDTGSSDLWVISNQCNTADCQTTVPLYSQSTFKSADLDVGLYYGDSMTRTHALGEIGQDTVNLAGLVLQDQYFAAINDTNTSVLDTGGAGIFGLGFPVNSFIWSEVFVDTYASRRRRRQEDLRAAHSWGRRSSNQARGTFPTFDFPRPSFPHQPRQASSESQWTSVITSSYATMGPFIPRLISLASLAAPMFAVTLQRNAIDRGGNLGLLSIGELPAPVQSDSLTWAPVRGYTSAEGGISAPPDSQAETYAIAWEVFIDAVYFDGQRLPVSQLADPSIQTSALIDTGNSLIRGPADVIDAIYTQIGGTEFVCSTPHNLTFEIGGKMFPVDPRDFISQAYPDSTDACIATIAVTDSPQRGQGYLYSWSLGDPFLKGVLSAYHFGNLSYPSQDPPTIGFLSTVPEDAAAQLLKALNEAKGNLAGTAQEAPTGVPTGGSTNSLGIQQADTTSVSSTTPNSGQTLSRTSWMVYFIMILAVVLVV